MKIRPKDVVDVAILNGHAARLNCKVAGLLAENAENENRGLTVCHDGEDFDAALKEFDDSIAYMVEK